MSDWNQIFRDAIKASGKTQYQLSKETGVSPSTLCHLNKVNRGLSLKTAERLAKAIGIELFVWTEEHER